MMFPMNMPELPQEFVDAISANPEGFAEAMGSGMEAFQGVMTEGGDMGGAFEAMGATMGPMMEDMGISPEVFDAVGDMVGASVGGAMHMGPPDAGGSEMGAMMQDGIDMMMPEGTEMPGPVMDALGDMGQGMADAGCQCHELAAEVMPPPGEPGFPLPCDAAGECIVPAGDPASCPPDACQPPPPDGACAEMGVPMMPPEGGYDHAPMPTGAEMPPPMEGPPPGEMGPPPGDMAGPPPGEMGPPPGDMAGPPPDMGSDAMGAMDQAFGDDGADKGTPPPMDDPMGAAMDQAAAQDDASSIPEAGQGAPDTMADVGPQDDGVPKVEEDDQSGGAAG